MAPSSLNVTILALRRMSVAFAVSTFILTSVLVFHTKKWSPLRTIPGLKSNNRSHAKNIFAPASVLFWDSTRTGKKETNFKTPYLAYNKSSCPLADFFASVDKTFNFFAADSVCDQDAQEIDIMCRIYLRQNGMDRSFESTTCALETSDRVPDIVYFVTFGEYEFKIWNYIAIVAAQRHVRPRALYVIGDQHPKGPWWEQVLRDVTGLRFVYRETPLNIAGRIVKYQSHLSDVVRLQTLFMNGGIYLDTDMVVLRSLDPILDKDITMGYIDPLTGLGNAFIACKRGNSFLSDWYRAYRNYKSTSWGHNSMEVSSQLYSRNISRVNLLSDLLYRPNWFQLDLLLNASHAYDWSRNYAMHIWNNNGRVPATVEAIQTDNSTVGQVFRYILYGDPKPREKDTKRPFFV